MFKQSDKLDEAAKGKDLSDPCDASCTNGYDNDGSTGYEIFSNGFRLAKKAEGRDVWEVPRNRSSYFFIGTEEEVLEKIRACDESDEDEDEDD